MADATPAPERWLPVVGWEGWYEVSDHGRVRRIGHARGVRQVGVVLKPAAGKHHLVVRLSRENSKRSFYVHRLVLEAFVGPRPDGYECNHKDGNNRNNHASNLEWVTRDENMAHARRMGLVMRPARGEQHGSAKLTAQQATEIRGLKGVVSPGRIAERYGVARGTIFAIFSGRNWRCLDESRESRS